MTTDRDYPEMAAARGRIEPAPRRVRGYLGDELIFMLEGSNFDESGEVRTGNANFRPNGCTHTVSSKNGGTAIAFVTGTVEMLK